MKMNPLMWGSVFLMVLFPHSVMAYIGPGGVVTWAGALLAGIAAIVVAIFGFLWYPIRRLIRRWKKSNDGEGNGKE